MTKSLKLILAGALVLASIGTVHAEAASAPHAVVLDMRGNPVLTKDGACVRTKWIDGHDLCAKEVKKPVRPLPPPVVREERTVYFAFNKSSLTKEAQSRLDSLVATIKAKGPVKSVHIAGYADRMGNAAYNEKLSKKRADAVKKYLSKKGVMASVLETRWFGDTIAAAKCPKKLKHKEKIACMQADRRVEVEVEFIPLPPLAPMPQRIRMK